MIDGTDRYGHLTGRFTVAVCVTAFFSVAVVTVAAWAITSSVIPAITTPVTTLLGVTTGLCAVFMTAFAMYRYAAGVKARAATTSQKPTEKSSAT